MNKNKYPCIESNNPMDYVKCALAIEVLAYHNKNFLYYNDNKSISEQIQLLLEQALQKGGGI
jgi:hypothetical protein